jgi:O-acetyl-ADP-ribose deacetylase (regulator of RNase III)
MKTTKGDLIQLALDGNFDVIIHGCNCFHTMGSGVARSIRESFPEAYVADRKKTKRGDIKKLGTVSTARTKHGVHVVNAYTQFKFGTGNKHISYKALRSCFRLVNRLFPDTSIRFGYPKIGAGLAGGDWDIIRQIIDEELAGRDHTLVEYDGKS